MRLLGIDEVNHVSGGCLLAISLVGISYLNSGDGWTGAVQEFKKDFSTMLSNIFELGTTTTTS